MSLSVNTRTMGQINTAFAASVEARDIGAVAAGTLTAAQKNLIQAYTRFLKKNGLISIPSGPFPKSLY